MYYAVGSCQKQGIQVLTSKLGSRTAWDEPNDRRHPNCCCPLPQSWRLAQHWTKRRGGLFTGISQLYVTLGGRLKQGSGVTSKGVPHTLGYYPFIRSLLFLFLGHFAEGPILSLLNLLCRQQTNIKGSKRPSSRWRAQRALDAVQHAGTETEIETGTRRSHQGIGIGTRPATQKTEIGGKRAVMPTRTADSADLPLHGDRHIMMVMV